MKTALLIFAGCTRVLGVHDFAAQDAAAEAPPDPVDAPPVIGDAPVDADTLNVGLLAHLTFDGNPVGFDSTGNGHDGTCNGTCALTNGKLGKAVAFNGTATMTLDKALAIGPFTLALWISPGMINGNTLGCAVSREAGTSTGYALCFSASQFEIAFGGASKKFAVMTGYHHYGLTWDGTKATTYVDGANVDTRDIDLALVNSKLFVGFEGRANDFTGSIDDLRYYDHALSVGELLQLTSGAQ